MAEELSLVGSFKKNVVSLLLDKIEKFEVTFDRAAQIAKFIRTSSISEEKAREIMYKEMKITNSNMLLLGNSLFLFLFNK